MVIRKAPVLALLAMLLGVTAGSSVKAQTIDYAHVLNLAGAQGMITQRIAKEVLLVALEIDKDRNLDDLKLSHRIFGQTLTGLRDGDDSLGIPPASNPAVLEGLDRAMQLWAEVDPILRDCLANRRVTRENAALIAELTGLLHAAVDEAATAYADASPDSGHFSMLVVAIDLSTRQQMLVQQMTKEFLLVTYGQDVQQNRGNLRETVSHFDAALNGLINGDLDQLLLPAPTEGIRSRLLRIERLWQDQLRPHMRRAIDGQESTPAEIQQVAQLNQGLLRELEATVRMYQAL